MRQLIKSKKWLIGLAFILVLSSGWFIINNEAEENQKSCFYSSLHHTGEGMRYWYEEKGGFKDITGIPYEQLDCKKCHIKSCEQCHAVKEGEKCSYSVKKARDSKTCLVCHSREKVTFLLGKRKGCLDIHRKNGMECADCHKGSDVHGDGVFYKTMRDSNAVSVSCKDCHSLEDDTSKAHTVHNGKLDCAACHIANSTSCLNCHFDSFLDQGKRAGNFFPPIQDWTILVNYQGKVTSGNVQTLVYKGKKFIAYAPYFTHAVQAKARTCADCHANTAVKRIKKGKSVPMAIFKDNKMISWKGVVPLVPDKLHWDFADKEDGKWILLKSKEKPMVQFACYAEPFTKEQVKKMARAYKK